MIRIDETEDLITQQCEICGVKISFSKIFEPKTDGNLPENYQLYVDPCEDLTKE